jgi:hypothetical protein
MRRNGRDGRDGRNGRSGRVALGLALLLVMVASQVASAECGGWGTVQNVSPYPGGQAQWVAIHVDGGGYPSGYYTSFRSTRAWAVGGSAYVYGCADASRYVVDPLVWK